MKKYRHTITFVTEIDESKMNPFTLMNWMATPEQERVKNMKESAKNLMKHLLVEANENGSWAIMKVADNG